MLNRIIRYFLENRIITVFLLLMVILGGLATSPFNWHEGLIPRDPVSVDAIPDIGDNQQIVATEWMGALTQRHPGADYLSADDLVVGHSRR
jgi:Cu(I)/Ag(I) efflux system membrane protein CusA/SilA